LTKYVFYYINKYDRYDKQIAPCETGRQVLIESPIEKGIGSQKDLSNVQRETEEKENDDESLEVQPQPAKFCPEILHRF